MLSHRHAREALDRQEAQAQAHGDHLESRRPGALGSSISGRVGQGILGANRGLHGGGRSYNDGDAADDDGLGVVLSAV